MARISSNPIARASQAAVADIRAKYVGFEGGYDTTSDRLHAGPGLVAYGLNYEPRLVGGYRRTGGYERFDGRARPSDASYLGMTASTVWATSVGQVLTGQTSGATGVVAYINAASTWIAVTQVTGTFTLGEVLKNAGLAVVGTYVGDSEVYTSTTQNTILAAAADVYRAAIGKVPGTQVRGICELNGTVYAWSDVSAAGAIYKSSASGWTAVPLYYELSFTGGSVQPAEGSTITQGAVTATVKRVVLESGAWTGGTAAGRYIVTAPAGGSFIANTAFSTAGAGGTPAAGASPYLGTQITLLANGDYAFDTGVFAGSVKRIYGCDGVNREFEFDGDVLVPLNTGMGSTRASCVCVHAKQLFLAYKHAVQHSAIGFPYQWTALAGAAEIGTSATVTNMLSTGGSQTAAALMIFTVQGVFVLYGTSDANYVLTNLSQETGADKFSAQSLSTAVSTSRNGIRISSSTQRFDNFSYDLASQRVDGYTKARIVTCSLLQRSRSLYRIFFNDGTGLVGVPKGSPAPGTPVSVIQWMPFAYNFQVRKCWRSEVNGVERMFASGDTGYVYELDVGRSFDGAAITAFLFMHPFTDDSPWQRKTFRQVDLEASGESPFTVTADFDYDYGDPDELVTPTRALMSSDVTSLYDVASWDTAYWDGSNATRLRFKSKGGGVAMGLRFYSSSASELPHTLLGASIYFTPRRQMR